MIGLRRASTRISSPDPGPDESSPEPEPESKRPRSDESGPVTSAEPPSLPEQAANPASTIRQRPPIQATRKILCVVVIPSPSFHVEVVGLPQSESQWRDP